MQINNIKSTNFGANPCKTTKVVLAGLERKGVDTAGLIEKMLNIFPNDSFKTHRFSDGTVRMDIFSSAASGSSRNVINTGDKLHLDINFNPLEPERLYASLNGRLDEIAAKRTPDEKIWDKIERLCKRG